MTGCEFLFWYVTVWYGMFVVVVVVVVLFTIACSLS